MIRGPSARPAVRDLALCRKAIDYVDGVVTRDGEQAICDIARSIQNAPATVDRHTTLSSIVGLELPTPLCWENRGFRPKLQKLDVIASPHQMGLMHDGAVGYLESFRGCPMSCTFGEWGAPNIAQGGFSEDYLTRELEAFAVHNVPAVFNVDAGLNLNAQAFRNLVAAEKKVGLLKKSGLWCEIYPSKITNDHLEFLSQCGPSYLSGGLQSFWVFSAPNSRDTRPQKTRRSFSTHMNAKRSPVSPAGLICARIIRLPLQALLLQRQRRRT